MEVRRGGNSPKGTWVGGGIPGGGRATPPLSVLGGPRVRATGALDGLDRTKHLSSLDLPQCPALLLGHRCPADRKLRHSWRKSGLGQKTQSGQGTVLSVGHEHRHVDQE